LDKIIVLSRLKKIWGLLLAGPRLLTNMPFSSRQTKCLLSVQFSVTKALLNFISAKSVPLLISSEWTVDKPNDGLESAAVSPCANCERQ